MLLGRVNSSYAERTLMMKYIKSVEVTTPLWESIAGFIAGGYVTTPCPPGNWPVLLFFFFSCRFPPHAAACRSKQHDSINMPSLPLVATVRGTTMTHLHISAWVPSSPYCRYKCTSGIPHIANGMHSWHPFICGDLRIESGTTRLYEHRT